MSDQRGTVLLEMIILGFATLLFVLPALMTIARIVDASASMENHARSVATWTARHGSLPDESVVPTGSSGVDIEVVVDDRSVKATARSKLTLVSVGGFLIQKDVVATFDARISPYRSSS